MAKHEVEVIRDGKGVPRWRIWKPFKRNGVQYGKCTNLDSPRGSRRVFKLSTGETSRPKAAQWLRDWCGQQIRKAEEQGPVPLTQPFEDRFKDWLSTKTCGKRTLDGYQSDFDGVLLPYFGKRFLDEITRLDVERFLKQLMQERTHTGERTAEDGTTKKWKRTYPAASVRTRAKHLTTLRSFFTWAVDHDLCRRNPVAGVKAGRGKKREGQALTHDEARKLLAACREKVTVEVKYSNRTASTQSPQVPKHLFLAVLISLHTGLRQSNVLGLKWSDVDLGRKRIFLPGERMKGHRDHEVPVHPELAEVLTERLQGRGKVPADELVLGRELDEIRKSYHAALRRAELPQIRWHDLRHTFGTWIGERAPYAVLSALMAHSPGTVTLKYSHPGWPAKVAAIESLPRLLSGGEKVKKEQKA